MFKNHGRMDTRLMHGKNITGTKSVEELLYGSTEKGPELEFLNNQWGLGTE
jgi:hypothetical protein